MGMEKTVRKYLNFKNFVIFICLDLVAIMVFYNIFEPKPISTHNEGLPRKQAEIKVKNTGKIVKLTVELAQSPKELELGLSRRAMMETGFGMYFVLPMRNISTFWMKDMRFPIDIIWIDEGKIVGIAKNSSIPKDQNNIPTFRSPQEVTNVLEVEAGFADKNNIKVGDTLILQ